MHIVVCIRFHVPTSRSKSPNWWRRLGIPHILQHPHSCAVSLSLAACLKRGRERAAIVENNRTSQDSNSRPLSLIAYHTSCTNQLLQKSELMEKVGHYPYTSTVFLRLLVYHWFIVWCESIILGHIIVDLFLLPTMSLNYKIFVSVLNWENTRSVSIFE